MARKNLYWLAARAVTLILMLALVFGSATVASAARDRTKPTQPTNFRVTAKTPFSFTLAWGPSSDNSGSFNYKLWSTAGPTVTLPKTATIYTWTTNIAPRNYYTFGIYAVDAAGNASAQATLQVTVPPDTVAPKAPEEITVNDVGSTYISLSWTPAVDDGPFLFYEVFVDGSLSARTGTSNATTLNLLQPDTTYSISVRAYDYGPNFSPLSTPISVTTDPVNTNDVTPPTVPGYLREDHFGDGEIHLDWNASTDDVDAQANIRYNVYVNGVLDHVLVGFTSTITYGVDGTNTIEITAQDTAGNVSAPAVLVFEMQVDF